MVISEYSAPPCTVAATCVTGGRISRRSNSISTFPAPSASRCRMVLVEPPVLYQRSWRVLRLEVGDAARQYADRSPRCSNVATATRWRRRAGNRLASGRYVCSMEAVAWQGPGPSASVRAVHEFGGETCGAGARQVGQAERSYSDDLFIAESFSSAGDTWRRLDPDRELAVCVLAWLPSAAETQTPLARSGAGRHRA